MLWFGAATLFLSVLYILCLRLSFDVFIYLIKLIYAFHRDGVARGDQLYKMFIYNFPELSLLFIIRITCIRVYTYRDELCAVN